MKTNIETSGSWKAIAEFMVIMGLVVTQLVFGEEKIISVVSRHPLIFSLGALSLAVALLPGEVRNYRRTKTSLSAINHFLSITRLALLFLSSGVLIYICVTNT